MNTILLEKKYILEYLKNTLHEIKIGTSIITNAKYHHNSDYCDAPSICQYGILTMKDLAKLKIKNYNDEFLQKMNDIESHVNGNDAVSLAVTGLQDLYPNEFEYNPINPYKVDFLVSSDIIAGRSSINYGNEFLSYKSIEPNQFKSIDIRLLKLIELIEQSRQYDTIENIIKKYNWLKIIALTMKEYNLDIPLREMSHENHFDVDIDKLSSSPKLILK